jgi:aminoglycoside phosphotransferase (APT) family kinase protein
VSADPTLESWCGNRVEALAQALEPVLGPLQGPLQVARCGGGQSNPSYRIARGSRQWLLRKKPQGPVLPSAHAVEREFRVIRALAGSGVPVPRALWLCEDTGLIGTPFYVMEFVEGRIFLDPALPGLAPGDRAALYDDINRVIARLHGLDAQALGLGDFGRPGHYLERQVARWTRQYRASETGVIDAMDRLIDWLPARLPPEPAPAVVHGDLRVDNMIVHPTEPRVLALIDWELATIGDPLADLAYHVLGWELGADDFRGMAGQPLRELGIPDAPDYVARYALRRGLPAPSARDWGVYIVYSLFRLAAILQGIARRALDGSANDPQAALTGARAARIADIGWARARALDAG